MTRDLEPLLRAILNLSTNPNFEVVRGWISDRLRSQRDLLSHDSELVVRRAQGCVKELSYLLDTIDNSEAIMAKILESESKARLLSGDGGI